MRHLKSLLALLSLTVLAPLAMAKNATDPAPLKKPLAHAHKAGASKAGASHAKDAKKTAAPVTAKKAAKPVKAVAAKADKPKLVKKAQTVRHDKPASKAAAAPAPRRDDGSMP